MSIDIEHISKSFGTFQVLRDIHLHIPTGELVALLGPSGSGKTSLLRIIAGLEKPDSGKIRFEGKDMTNRSVRERGVGFVFQHYALFRHMNVFENIAFGLKVRPRSQRPSRSEIKEKVEQLLQLVKMEEYANHYPSQLSGGQRQRIALARALAVEPNVLLLDEPFGALDAQVRKQLRRWLRRLHDEISITSIFVTHDQEEAMDVADRIVVMNEGKIEQVGTPEEIYEHPRTPFVCQFIGNANRFRGTVQDGRLQIGTLSLKAPDIAIDHHKEAIVYARPEHLELSRENPGPDSFITRVQNIHAAGPVIRLELTSEDGEWIEAELDRERFQTLRPQKGDSLFVRLKNARVFAYPK